MSSTAEDKVLDNAADVASYFHERGVPAVVITLGSKVRPESLCRDLEARVDFAVGSLLVHHLYANRTKKPRPDACTQG